LRIVDIISGIILVLTGFLFCIFSFDLGIGKLNNPGPGFLPFVVGGFLILLSLGVIFGGSHIKQLESKPSLFKGRRSGVALSVLVSLTAYSLVLDILGFVLATFLLLTFLFSISEKQTLKVVLGASMLATAFAYLLFGYFLKVTLPIGYLGF
jgi:putative tricarboxylic transport membrane protein